MFRRKIADDGARGDRVYEFGPFSVDPAENRILRGDKEIALTPKAFDLLLVFLQNPDRLLEKTWLLNAVWRDAVVEEGSLNRCVSTLRRAIGGEESDYIETIPKRGYRFTATVRERRHERAGARPATPRTFKLTDAVCRSLNRATLDPRVIGGDLAYMDNEVESSVLVFLLPTGAHSAPALGLTVDGPLSRDIADALWLR